MFHSPLLDREIMIYLSGTAIVFGLPILVMLLLDWNEPTASRDFTDTLLFIAATLFVLTIIVFSLGGNLYTFTLTGQQLKISHYFYWWRSQNIAFDTIEKVQFYPMFGKFPAHSIMIQTVDNQIIRLDTAYEPTYLGALKWLQRHHILLEYQTLTKPLPIHQSKLDMVKKTLQKSGIVFVNH